MALLVLGIIMLIVEVVEPGFFIAIPGTVMLVLGLLGVLYPPILESAWTPVIIVVVGLPAFVGTIWFYRRFGPVGPPITTGSSSLVGKTGIVTTDIESEGLRGKVKIESDTWSAVSNQHIPSGTHIVVVESEGVHVKVRPLDGSSDKIVDKK